MSHKILLVACVLGILSGVAGCTSCRTCDNATIAPDVPRELAKVSHPPYVIEPPDILLVDAIRVVPLPPYHLNPLDAISVVAPEKKTLPGEPLQATFTIEPDGSINLGGSYGRVSVIDKTIEEAKAAIEKHLKTVAGIPDPQVTVSLAQFRGLQQIKGDHLVRPDGTIGLGLYGSVYVTGMTIEEAKFAIERHLATHLSRPEISVDIYSYNSKVVYVVTDGGGYGEQVYPIPATGNETVLDAIGKIGGLPSVASKRRIWVARPAPAGQEPAQILPVNWDAIVQGANTTTNYQLLPYDRLYVMADPLVTTDTFLARFISPIERLFGITLLGNTTIRDVAGRPQNGGQ
jgi:polysaccharide export outer membrane protein